MEKNYDECIKRVGRPKKKKSNYGVIIIRKEVVVHFQ